MSERRARAGQTLGHSRRPMHFYPAHPGELLHVDLEPPYFEGALSVFFGSLACRSPATHHQLLTDSFSGMAQLLKQAAGS